MANHFGKKDPIQLVKNTSEPIQFGRGDKTSPDYFDSVFSMLDSDLEPKEKKKEEGFVAKVKKKVAGPPADAFYQEGGNEDVKDALSEWMDEGPLQKFVRKKIANPIMARELTTGLDKREMEQKQSEHMLKDLGTKRKMVKASEFGDKVLGAAGTVLETVPFATRGTDGVRAVNAGGRAVMHGDMADDRRKLGTYDVSGDGIHSAHAELHDTERTEDLVQAIGHTTNAVLGLGGGIVKKGLGQVTGLSSKKKENSKARNRAILDSDNLDSQFAEAKRQAEFEEQQQRELKTGGFLGF
ncbi:MAG: hypothetical protein ACKVKQ_05900 [Flavobacteriales bacterium]